MSPIRNCGPTPKALRRGFLQRPSLQFPSIHLSIRVACRANPRTAKRLPQYFQSYAQEPSRRRDPESARPCMSAPAPSAKPFANVAARLPERQRPEFERSKRPRLYKHVMLAGKGEELSRSRTRRNAWSMLINLSRTTSAILGRRQPERRKNETCERGCSGKLSPIEGFDP